jgi:hypothetical protein
MSTDQIKTEINKVLDKLSDKTLEDLLIFLQNFGGRQNSLFDKNMLEKILSEDRNLLDKLAR